ncbi:MAG: bifunctional adenosylcobinamide kinase/adenosylcobinamide-phosphate guanylyltransferase [Anaerolineaceae bacterium]
MPKKMTLILGGARSGKSSYAEERVSKSGQEVIFLATAQAGDEEMAARIAAHRAGRPNGWLTLEAPLHCGRKLFDYRQTGGLILLDCLTLLASNILLSLPEPLSQAAADEAVDREIDDLLKAYSNRQESWLVISNEVGLGLVPPYPLGRTYRDSLGRANQRMAAAADEVIFMVAGLPMWLKGRE